MFYEEDFIQDVNIASNQGFSNFEQAVSAYNDSDDDKKKLEDFVDRIRVDKRNADYYTTLDSHLNSPLIVDDPLDYLRDLGNVCCPHHTRLVTAIRDSGFSANDVIFDIDGILYTLYSHFSHLFSRSGGDRSELFKDCMEASIKAYDIASEHWYRFRSHYFDNASSGFPPSLVSAFNLFLRAKEFKNQLTRKERQQMDLEKFDYGVSLVGSYFICDLGSGIVVLKSNFLIGALDIFTMQFNARLISFLNDFVSPNPIPLYPIVNEFLVQMENLLIIYKNKAYQIFKNLEALIVGFILNVTDPDIQNPLFESTMESLELEGLLTHGSPLVKLIKETGISPEGRKILLNCSGLAKAWGNPTIDSVKGVEKLKELTRVKKELDPKILLSTRATFRKRFCKEYFRKHGKFPKVRWTEYDKARIHPNFREVIETGKWFNEDREPKLTDEDWTSFKFEKTLNFDYMENIEKILSDKAISPPLRDWAQDYCKCAFKRSGQQRPTFSRNTTRLMNFILEQEENISIEDLIRLICSRDVPQDWLRIKLQDKELELSDSGRKFSTQTPYIRLYQTVTEHNIADSIMKYLNYQSMTIGEIRTEQRVTSMAKLQTSAKGSQLYFLNLDLEKWNMCFRWETCQGIAEDMDDLFGLENCITYSHEFFAKCVFTYPSTVAPQIGCDGLPLEGPGCHIGQPGGCEGLRQKLWTAVTAGIIDSSAEILGIPISLLCQGDNQTLLAKIPEGEESKIKQLSDLISLRLSKAGMKLKEQETWTSRHLVSYSKRYYIDGVAVDDFLKASLRVSGDQNSDFPCLLNEIGTISTGGESVAKGSSNPAPGFVMAMFHTSLGISMEHKLPPKSNEVLALLFCNPSVGCYPVSQFSNYCLRGTPDPITDFLSRAYHINNNYPEVARPLRSLMSLDFGASDKLKNIVKDPLSLNLKVPVTPVVGIEILLKGILRKKIKYPRFRELYDLHTTDQQDEFLNALVTADRVFPVVLNKIFSMSPFGVLNRLEARFDNTNSLVKLISKEYTFNSLKGGIEIFVKIHRKGIEKRIRSGERAESDFLSIFNGGVGVCTYVTAQTLRDKSWGVKIHGVTTPCPVEQVEIKDWKCVEPDEAGWTITIKISDLCSLRPWQMHLSVGPFVPYLGSETSEKVNIVKTPTGRLLSDSNMEKLRKLYVWLKRGVGPNVVETLKNIIRSMIPEDLDQEDNELLGKILSSQDVEVYGGCWTHRMSSAVINSGCYLNQKYNPSTHIQFSPTSATNICRGAANRTIFFQNLQIYAISVLSNLALRSNSMPPAFAMVIICPGCSAVVPDETFDFPSAIEVKIRTPFTRSEVEYVSEMSETFEESSSIDPGHALSYYLATKCKLDFDLYIRAQDTHTGLHQLISTNSPASTNYNKTEVASCNIHEMICMLIEMYPEIRYHIITLEMVVCESVELLIRASSWLPLLGIATAMIGTDRIQVLLSECCLSNTQFLLGFNKYRVVSLLYSAIRKMCRVRFEIPSIIHLTENRWDFHKKMIFLIKKHSLESRAEIQDLMENEKITPQAILDSPNAKHILMNHVYFVNNPESCLYRWRTNPVMYSGPTLSIGCVNSSIGKLSSCTLGFSESEWSEQDELMCANEATPKDPTPLYSKYSHHYWRFAGNVSTSCTKQLDLLSYVESLGIDLKKSTNLFCADGAGSMMVATLHKYPNSYAVFNTLIRDNEFPQGNPDTYLPACVTSDCHNLEERILDIRKTTLCQTNVFHPEFIALLRSLGFQYDLVNIDVETSGSDVTNDLVELVFNLSKLMSEDGVLIVRYHVPDCRTFFKGYGKICKSIRVTKPYSSSHLTSETYLVIMRSDIYDSKLTSRSIPPRSFRSYEGFCKSIQIEHQLRIEPLMNRHIQLKEFGEVWPCLDMKRHDLETLGLSTDLLHDNIQNEFLLCIGNLCMMGYEITKRTSENHVARMLRDTNREMVVGVYIKRIILLHIMVKYGPTMSPLELSQWVRFKHIEVSVIYNPNVVQTYIFINENVPTFRGDILIYKFLGSVEECLGNYTKILFRLHLNMKLRLRGDHRYTFVANTIKKLIKVHSKVTGVNRDTIQARHKRFFDKVMDDLESI